MLATSPTVEPPTRIPTPHPTGAPPSGNFRYFGAYQPLREGCEAPPRRIFPGAAALRALAGTVRGEERGLLPGSGCLVSPGSMEAT